MKIQRLLAAASAALLLAVPAAAQFTVGGPGGLLNASGTGGTGGGGNSGDTLPTSWSEYPAAISVSSGSTSIDSVTLTGLNHTWSGDLQIVLKDPSGLGYNLVVRIGLIAPAPCCGHSADFGADYTILAAGDPALDSSWPLVNPGAAVVIPGGNYPQEFGTTYGAGWVDGSDNVFNVDLASIPVVPGVWSLFVYDGAGGDTGDLGGWSMSGDGVISIGTNYCMANSNSTGTIGRMEAFGSTSVAANVFVLRAVNLPNQAFGFFITSQSQGFTPTPNGSQGNLCLAGAPGRYVGFGQIQNTMSAGSMQLSINLDMIPTPTGFVPVVAGEFWNFQAWYRDANPMATSNLTDAIEVQFTN